MEKSEGRLQRFRYERTDWTGTVIDEDFDDEFFTDEERPVEGYDIFDSTIGMDHPIAFTPDVTVAEKICKALNDA